MARLSQAGTLAACGVAFLVCALVGLPASAQAIQALTNGDFELDTISNGGSVHQAVSFTGWTEANVGIYGSWYNWIPGAVTTWSQVPAAPNPFSGNVYALSDHTEPSCCVLLQSFTIPPGASNVTLSYQMFVNDWGPAIYDDPPTLGNIVEHSLCDFGRVDILTGTANFLDTGAGVLQNLYLGADSLANTNNNVSNPYTSYSFNLTPLLGGGGTFQLRFADDACLYYFNMGVDNVSLTYEAGTGDPGGAPEPCTLGILALGALGLLGRARHRPR